jgi:acyl-coenzyme A thioesterase PaaI-like protein
MSDAADRQPADDAGTAHRYSEPDPETVRAELEALHVRRPGPRQAATRRVGAAMRQLMERLVGTAAPPEALERAATALEDIASELHFHDQHGRLYEGFAEAATAGRPAAFFDWSPILGAANPLAPPLQIRTEEDRVVATGRFGSAYEGPPGCVHGGFIAAAFDDVLGLAQTLTGKTGMTGTLEIRYRRPTPLHTDLRFEAHPVAIDGRKLRVEGWCTAPGPPGEDDQLTAEAKGLFIQVPPERFGRLLAERERRSRS